MFNQAQQAAANASNCACIAKVKPASQNLLSFDKMFSVPWPAALSKRQDGRAPKNSRSIHLLKAFAVAGAAFITPASEAAITVTLVDGAALQDTVVVTSDAADSIGVSCLSGLFSVNGSAVLGGALACNAKPNLSVQGGPLSNVIDLSAMTEAAFASGLRIRVQGGAGADTIIGSVFSESLDGGLGDDLMDRAAWIAWIL
jgi:hypothetical protein